METSGNMLAEQPVVFQPVSQHNPLTRHAEVAVKNVGENSRTAAQVGRWRPHKLQLLLALSNVHLLARDAVDDQSIVAHHGVQRRIRCRGAKRVNGPANRRRDIEHLLQETVAIVDLHHNLTKGGTGLARRVFRSERADIRTWEKIKRKESKREHGFTWSC